MCCALHVPAMVMMCNDSIDGKLLFDFKVAASVGDKILLYWQQGVFRYLW